MACARTRCFDQGQALRALVAHVPKKQNRRGWGPWDAPGRRRTYGTSTTRARLRQLGNVTSILRQKRRNAGSPAAKIWVTNLPDVTARPVVDAQRWRWTLELLMKEGKGTTGLGQQQVTNDPHRVERSVARSVMADRIIVKVRAQNIPKQGSWSLLTLQPHFP